MLRERSALYGTDGRVSHVTRIANDGTRTAGREFLYLRVDAEYTSFRDSDFYCAAVCLDTVWDL